MKVDAMNRGALEELSGLLVDGHPAMILRNASVANRYERCREHAGAEIDSGVPRAEIPGSRPPGMLNERRPARGGCRSSDESGHAMPLGTMALSVTARTRTWPVLLVLALAGCSGSRASEPKPPRDPADCRDWVDPVPAVPELTLEGASHALAPRTPSACLSGDAVFVGRTRVPFAAARAGEPLSAALLAALPEPRTRSVDLWAPASRRAADVLLIARAFSRAGVRVTLVGRRGDVGHAIARIEPPRSDTVPADPGAVPDDVELWVEMAPDRSLIRATDGAYIPIERDPGEPRAMWDALTQRLREQRHMTPRRRRVVFAPEGALSYAEWAHALEIALREGYDRIELTPVGALEALTAVYGRQLLARRGGVHPLPLEAPSPALIPPEYAAHQQRTGGPEPAVPPPIRSHVRVDALDVGGHLDFAEVESVVREHMRDFSLCHERAPGADLRLEGRVTLGVIVSGSGRVQSVGAAPTIDETTALDNEALIDCLRAQVARWVFTPSRMQQLAGIRLTLVFRASRR